VEASCRKPQPYDGNVEGPWGTKTLSASRLGGGSFLCDVEHSDPFGRQDDHGCGGGLPCIGEMEMKMDNERPVVVDLEFDLGIDLESAG
jgi:hypothetical protein